MMIMKCCSLFISYLFILFFRISSATDTFDVARPIRDGDTIVSSGGRFQMGFFSLDNSHRYLGIWFNKISPMTVVWVANREIPLLDFSGVLRISNQGRLEVLNGTKGVVWTANSSISSSNLNAQLLESGNFVVRDGNSGDSEENIFWQSFDHPGDTLLPGMKLGINKITGQKWSLTSWKDVNDPTPGDYKMAVDPNRFTQLVMTKNSVVYSPTGPWNGQGFNGAAGLKTNPFLKFDFVNNQTLSFYTTQVRYSSVISRLVLTSAGLFQRYIWFNDSRGWELYSTVVTDSCHRYAVCGPYGNCNMNNFHFCGCLPGFESKSLNDTNSEETLKGCARKKKLSCTSGDVFKFISGLKLPDTLRYWFNRSMSLQACQKECLKKCSCTAYANPLVEAGVNACLIWFGDLIDVRVTTDNPDGIYIRLAASELGEQNGLKLNVKSHKKKRLKILASCVSVLVMTALILGLLLYKRRRRNPLLLQQQGDGDENDDFELPFFDWDTISNATENFSFLNKLGEGGFGPVYKGVLRDGLEIAVKRLSMSSKQGEYEFKNEVLHIAKLQHRNLVRILGYCIKIDEKMLIYEYMHNKSLDTIIFDGSKSKALDWPKRFNIINGIARGLLYLHQDSRLRIIHRDLKASNVLLDKDLNSKISDFGMARTFGGNETEANTRRVVGTYGYMSPEYAIDGIYSIKSDVYSFGVLLLEILNGRSNRGFYYPGHNLNLLGHAWKLHMEDRALEIINFSVDESRHMSEVMRSIQVGLLCVQRRPEDRPNMSYVVLMLSGDGVLPSPKQPGFFNERDPFETDTSSSQNLKDPFSTNEISITNLDPR